MPFAIRKIRGQDLYKVYNKETGEIHSKGSTKQNSIKQMKLLYMIENEKNKKVGGMIDDSKYSNYPKLQRDLNLSYGSGFYCQFK
jgi:hypothetical protein